MDYKSCFEIVKRQNPELSYKEQQTAASKMLKEFKVAQAGYEAGGNKTTPGISEKIKKDIEQGSITQTVVKGPSMSQLAIAEKRLKSNPIDVNSLRTIGGEAIPKGKIVKHGMEGVNTLVSFEDEDGNKLPIIGYFRIWM
jgi:hypothetical protein